MASGAAPNEAIARCRVKPSPARNETSHGAERSQPRDPKRTQPAAINGDSGGAWIDRQIDHGWYRGRRRTKPSLGAERSQARRRTNPATAPSEAKPGAERTQPRRRTNP